MPRDQFYEQLAPSLGHVIIEHGNLEGDAGRMLARLNGKGDDVSAAAYAAGNTFNEKIEKARKLVDLKNHRCLTEGGIRSRLARNEAA